jgi:hypothetical protein
MKLPRIRLLNVLLSGLAIGVGVLTLAGYFITDPTAGLLSVRLQLVAWGSVLAAIAVWLGTYNLMRVHFRKLISRAPGWVYSIFAIIGFIVALVVGLLPPMLTNPYQTLIFRDVITATGSAISALLLFVLVLAGFRLFRRPVSLTSVVFIATAIASLILMAPVLAGISDDTAKFMRELWAWISQVPAVAGARGLMLGIALGIIATSLRVLLAMDRPYGD